MAINFEKNDLLAIRNEISIDVSSRSIAPATLLLAMCEICCHILHSRVYVARLIIKDFLLI